MSGKSVPEPNYTQAPNFFFDHIMLEITSTAELKVTLAVIRQTFGYHRKEDLLSLSRLQELTGLSRESVADGIQRALQRGYVGRRKVGQSYVYGLRVASQDSRPLGDSTSQGSRPPTSQDSRHTKESKKESPTGGEQSSASSKVESLAQHTMKAIYQAMKDATFTVTKKDYGQQVGRVQWMLENMYPTEAELDELPAIYVRSYKIRGAATDAVYALNEVRRQKARAEVLAESSEAPHAPSFYELQNHDKPKGAIWYASLYESADFATVEGWIKEGLTHSQIEQRLEVAKLA